MHFPWSKPTRTERPRETFTYRQRQTSTATSSSRRSRKTRTARPTPAVVCPANDYIPHHRNLGLAPWATSAEIRAAWRALSLRLHPDKSRDPAAARAMAVVNTSYEELRRGREGAVYRWVENWLLDGEVDSSERARRRAEAGACRAVVRRKPWVRDYREWEERGGGREGEVVFNEAFWVNGVHRVVDSTMPRLWTDWMWDLDRGWRVDGRNGTENGDGLERLEFYGSCYSVYTVMLPRVKGSPVDKKWSHYADTDCARTPLEPGMGDVMLIAAGLLFWRREIAWAGRQWWSWCVLWPLQGVKAVWRGATWPARWSRRQNWLWFAVSWFVYSQISLVVLGYVLNLLLDIVEEIQ